MIGALIVCGIAALAAGVALKKHKALAAVSTIIATTAAFVAFPKLPASPLAVANNLTVKPIWAWVAVIIAGLLTALLVIQKKPWGLITTVIMVWALFLALPNLTFAFANLGSNITKTATQFVDDLTNTTGVSGSGNPASPLPSPVRPSPSKSRR